MRLVDADALPISVGWMDLGSKQERSKQAHCAFVFERDIKDAPTVDAVEVKHGHWEEKQVVDDSTIIEIWQSARCSKCGRYHTTPYAYYFDEFNYCPQCGAKMDEVTE